MASDTFSFWRTEAKLDLEIRHRRETRHRNWSHFDHEVRLSFDLKNGSSYSKAISPDSQFTSRSTTKFTGTLVT